MALRNDDDHKIFYEKTVIIVTDHTQPVRETIF